MFETRIIGISDALAILISEKVLHSFHNDGILPHYRINIAIITPENLPRALNNFHDPKGKTNDTTSFSVQLVSIFPPDENSRGAVLSSLALARAICARRV